MNSIFAVLRPSRMHWIVHDTTRRRLSQAIMNDAQNTTDCSTSRTICKQQLLLDEAQNLMAQQHAHMNGPWRAMSQMVQEYYHHQRNQQARRQGGMQNDEASVFKVLDLACGIRGEPGSTIAHALPLAHVHCTDFSADVVKCVRTTHSHGDENRHNSVKNGIHNNLLVPPSNLTKSIADLTDLTQFQSNSIDAITCCYGYNLIPEQDIPFALAEAFRILRPGGALVICNWEESALQRLGNQVLRCVREGGSGSCSSLASDSNDSLFLPPTAAHSPIVLSGAGGDEFAIRLTEAGFGHTHIPVVVKGSYPFNLGHQREMQLAMGTATVREQLEELDALPSKDMPRRLDAGGWSCLAEECFWVSLGKYATTRGEDGTLWLNENTFKLTLLIK